MGVGQDKGVELWFRFARLIERTPMHRVGEGKRVVLARVFWGAQGDVRAEGVVE